MSEPFSYDNEIDGEQLRLVEFRWGPNNSIFGTVKTFSLRSKPRPFYKAASYFCGSKLHDNPIYLSNYGQERPVRAFQVYESLYPLLELFCDHQGFEPELWWWIDSICINKHDSHERQAQVKIMQKIYAAADRTIIWLGTRSFDSDLAIDFLHDLEGKRHLLEEDPKEILKLQVPDLSYKWKAMESLLEREWWRRVWTVQELLISPRATFYCGTKSFRTSRFKMALYSMALCRSADHPLIRNNIWDPAWNRRRLLQYYRRGKEMPIISIMAFLGDNEVTLPQDRINALLGMVSSFDQGWIGEADYESDIADVYCDFARSHIKACKTLDIICFAHIFNKTAVTSVQGKSLPSWVPDWRAQVRPRATLLMVSQDQAKHIGNFRPLWMKSGNTMFQAAGPREPQYFIDETSGRLSCEGIILDHIDGPGALTDEDGKCSFDGQKVQSTSQVNLAQALKPEIGSLMDVAQVQKLLREIAFSLNVNRHDKHLLDKAMPRCFSDFVAFCLAAHYFPDTVQAEFLSWYQWNRSLLIRGYSLQQIFSSKELIPLDESLEALMLRSFRNDESPLDIFPQSLPMLRRERIPFDIEGFLPRFHDTTLKWQRRLVVTMQGHIGMAPARADKEFVVAVLFGCSVPVVLNPVGRGIYEFIGECYVHGYMEGEIMKELEEGTRQQQTFNLQ